MLTVALISYIYINTVNYCNRVLLKILKMSCRFCEIGSGNNRFLHAILLFKSYQNSHNFVPHNSITLLSAEQSYGKFQKLSSTLRLRILFLRNHLGWKIIIYPFIFILQQIIISQSLSLQNSEKRYYSFRTLFFGIQ